MIDAETIEFMRKLDVKEIHGYDASLGLKLIKPSALGETGKSSASDGAKAAARVPELAGVGGSAKTKSK